MNTLVTLLLVTEDQSVTRWRFPVNRRVYWLLLLRSTHSRVSHIQTNIKDHIPKSKRRFQSLCEVFQYDYQCSSFLKGFNLNSKEGKIPESHTILLTIIFNQIIEDQYKKTNIYSKCLNYSLSSRKTENFNGFKTRLGVHWVGRRSR